ncbi:transcriptional regulator NrdR [Patescibacteria group bacterium]|jgi:transcriptional repressor NrdR|nr:transcriptional regulator NrdR [Patescibacteria group bacterium]
MFCPVCNHPDTRVLDTRVSLDGTSIRRRRQCDECDYRFSTSETVELLNLVIIKRDGSHELYSREKIERGLRRALEKRPHTEADFRGLVAGIERDVQRLNAQEVRSSDIGTIIMERLKSFDKVAYIRFASVYRSFEDVKTFQAELDRLVASSRGKKKKAKKSGKPKRRKSR